MMAVIYLVSVLKYFYTAICFPVQASTAFKWRFTGVFLRLTLEIIGLQ